MELEEVCDKLRAEGKCDHKCTCAHYPEIVDLTNTMNIKLEYARDRGLITDREKDLRQTLAKADIGDLKLKKRP
jgi:hypothetical protein